ncbi:MAG: phage tail protein [Sphingopyxis sp.]|nr:phage tail protein [Sphingopyxis sp.]
MATLVLSTVGTVVGGPIGSAIGATIGQAIDSRLFRPKRREGPRLSDLRVQTSSYGTPIPRLFGTMRVAGTIIWATDLVEHRHRQSNGKGQPRTTTSSYSVSFAVALSSRAIVDVGRIWAEGNILRGAAGDFKSACTFRLYRGGEDQPVDPFIASAMGPEHTPAYRGIAYAVFEDFDLAPFGNRLPSLSFEVVADAAALTLANPLGDCLGNVESAAPLPSIAGAVLTAATAGEAAEPLLALVRAGHDPADDGSGTLRWLAGPQPAQSAQPLPPPAVDTTGQRVRAAARRSIDGGEGAAIVSVASYDPARDHQMGWQRARVPRGDATAMASGPAAEERLSLPLALSAGQAKAVAWRLARDRAAQSVATDWPAGFAALALRPGAAVTVPGEPGVAWISERRIEGAGVRLSVNSERGDTSGSVAADSGVVAAAPDLAIGDTVAALFDLPAPNAAAASNLVLAAAGTGPGWRSGSVRLIAAPGGEISDYGSITAARALGQVVALGAQFPWPVRNDAVLAAAFDDVSMVVVRLASPDMVLNNADDAALLGGANMAAMGSELFQFGHAEPIGNSEWRLTRLLRGRRGTEDAIAETSIGAAFVLLDDPALVVLPPALGLTPLSIGGGVTVTHPGNGSAGAISIAQVGRGLRPMSPAQLTAQRTSDGAIALQWVRRGRAGYDWADRIDAPDDEAGEQYRLTMWQGAAAIGINVPGVVSMDVSAAAYIIDAASVTAWAATGAPLNVRLTRIGAHGESAGAMLTIPLV